MTSETMPGSAASHFLFKGAGHDHLSNTFYCAFTGPSMFPTLREADLLIISSYSHSRPRIGDVIIFTTDDPDQPVVHRIIGRLHNRFRTRGDNCSAVDLRLINHDDILGRVIGSVRAKRQLSIAGGPRGLCIHFFCRIFRFCLPVLSGIHRMFLAFT